ncbi:MAG: hypothetical protein J6T76_05325 [Paludibacteraceae bacterium]|nr:hypothetical protein [Paludibacteraceae bacterium]
MKKFIAPEVKVVRYDSSILCVSAGMGEDIGEGEDVNFDAPGRRRGIFDDSEPETKTSRR